MEVKKVSGISREIFWSKYGKKGAIGLVGGTSFIHRAICEAQVLITPDGKPSKWAHVFIFAGKGSDGKLRIVESDIMFKPLKLKVVNGAQVNRIDKYYGKDKALRCAVLDLGLSRKDADKVVKKAYELMEKGTLYPVSGLFGTLFAYILGTERLRNTWNARNALYCSAFVQRSYEAVGIDLAPKVHLKNTGPEHIWQTKAPHETYLLKNPK